MFRHFLAKTLQALELKAIYCQNVQAFSEKSGMDGGLEQTIQNPGKHGKQAFQAIFLPFNIKSDI
jgi:hypothetical protein